GRYSQGRLVRGGYAMAGCCEAERRWEEGLGQITVDIAGHREIRYSWPSLSFILLAARPGAATSQANSGKPSPRRLGANPFRLPPSSFILPPSGCSPTPPPSPV